LSEYRLTMSIQLWGNAVMTVEKLLNLETFKKDVTLSNIFFKQTIRKTDDLSFRVKFILV